MMIKLPMKKVLLAGAFLYSILSADASFASGIITVSGAPTISSNTQHTSLGTIFITIPEYALKAGDQVTLTLPKGFTLNTPFDPQIRTSQTTLNGANGAIMYAGFAPEEFAGIANQLGNNTVTLKVYKIGTPTDDFKLAIKLGDIAVNGPKDGPVNISFDAPSTSAFPTTPKSQPIAAQSSSPSSTPAQPSAQSEQGPSGNTDTTTLTFTLGQSTYSIDNKQNDMDVTPYLDASNHIMLPLRFTANALGITDQDISWDPVSQTATLKKDKQVITFTVGQQAYTMNGESILIDTPLSIISDRVMVPIRYLSEALGFKVDWEEGNSTVRINSY